MHAFAYRRPRVIVAFAVEFRTAYGVLFGTSEDLSEEGLSVRFCEPVLPKQAGTVRLRTGQCIVELQAQVGHLDGFTAGLRFTFSCEEERQFVLALVQALSKIAARGISAQT